jgi:hypothetical protein
MGGFILGWVISDPSYNHVLIISSDLNYAEGLNSELGEGMAFHVSPPVSRWYCTAEPLTTVL